MRILLVTGLTGFGIGGAQSETIHLTNELAAQGHGVGIVIDCLPAGTQNVMHFVMAYPPSKVAAAQVRSAIQSFKPDIVHVIGGGISFLNQMNDSIQPIPWVFTAHNLPPFERASGILYGHNVLHYIARNIKAFPSTVMWKLFLRRASFKSVICHSQIIAERLVRYGCEKYKIREIPFGFDPPQPVAGGESPFGINRFPKMLSIGGFIHHKGFHDVIRVMPDLRRRFSGIQLCIIGESRDARYASYLEQLIAIEGLSECVSLVRNASDATKSAALSEADIYVQPSHEEGFCLAFAEAAAIAPRLVGTRTGEIPGFASDDPSAIVVAPKRPLDLLNAITTLVESDSHSKSAKSRGIRLAERYTWSSYVSKHVATYRGQPGN